jgi:hypothetical protein
VNTTVAPATAAVQKKDDENATNATNATATAQKKDDANATNATNATTAAQKKDDANATNATNATTAAQKKDDANATNATNATAPAATQLKKFDMLDPIPAVEIGKAVAATSKMMTNTEKEEEKNKGGVNPNQPVSKS